MADGGWETLPTFERRYGVMSVEAPDADPIAMFREEAHARAWLEYMQAHPDEDERLDDYYDVFVLADVRAIFWNSYDRAPAPAPRYQDVEAFELGGGPARGEVFRG